MVSIFDLFSRTINQLALKILYNFSYTSDFRYKKALSTFTTKSAVFITI